MKGRKTEDVDSIDLGSQPGEMYVCIRPSMRGSGSWLCGKAGLGRKGELWQDEGVGEHRTGVLI